MTKKIAAITMARNDVFFLSRWIAYYGDQLGRENLYVILDGFDQEFWPEYAGVNILQMEHKELSRTAFDKLKSDRVSDLARDLFARGYDIVIGCDSDEFLVTDTDKGLALYLSGLEINTSVSGLGLDVGQHLKKEKALDKSKSFLSQRSYALLNTRYTKPVVINRPVRWGRGFHSIKKHNFHIDKHLFLLHFGGADIGIIGEKSKIKDWGNHLKRRARTSLLVTYKKPAHGCWIGIARIMQQIFRPFYSPRKPGMLGIKKVVSLPQEVRKLSL